MPRLAFAQPAKATLSARVEHICIVFIAHAYSIRPIKMPRLAKQIELKFRTHGGTRRGAGRKRKGPRAWVPHRARPRFKPSHPLHVTLRVVGDAPNLRSPRAFTLILDAFRAAAERFGC